MYKAQMMCFFMTIADVFTDVDAGAQFIDSPYVFLIITFYKLNSQYNIHKHKTALHKYKYILVMFI
jgi:hypothetical protein